MLAAILFLQEEAVDVAEEGKHIITAMLVVGLIFVAVILIGQALRHLGTRRRRKAARAKRAY